MLKDGALYIVLFNTTHSVYKPGGVGGREGGRETEMGGDVLLQS